MSINKVLEKITEKWPAKVICLVLAIFLYILHQTSLLEKKTLVVPLTVKENGDFAIIGTVPDSISIVIRAEKDSISKITAGNFKADINLDVVSESGQYVFPVNVHLSDDVLALDPLEVQIKPENISATVEKRILRYVPVNPSIVGEVANGYAIDNVEVNPPYVPLVGPESLVSSVESIYTTRVNVSNAENNFTAEAEAYSISKLVDIQDKGPYKVTVSLKQIDGQKDYNEIVVVLNNVPQNLRIVGNTPKVNVTLAGKIPFLEKYVVGRNFVTADFSEITEAGTYEIPLNYTSNSNFEIIKKSAEVITVTFTEKYTEQVSEENVEKTVSSDENTEVI